MAYPFKKYNYKVEIDGITEASFSEVSGFDASIDVIEYRTGDEGVNWSRKMNGLTKFGNVTLKWGMTSSMSFYDWVTSISQGTSLGEDHNKNVTITLFDDFGIEYYGPINGHDLSALMTVLENVKGINHPVLIHVETKKGKGYAEAEAKPDKFHEATDTMLGLFRKTPVYPAKIELARQQLLKKMTAAKNFGNLVGIWFKAQEIGVDHDWRQDIFEALQNYALYPHMTVFDNVAFAMRIVGASEKEIAKRIYEIYIVGPVEKLDRQKLTKYGEVIDVTRKEIFGF